jgi:hypothetical protein
VPKSASPPGSKYLTRTGVPADGLVEGEVEGDVEGDADGELDGLGEELGEFDGDVLGDVEGEFDGELDGLLVVKVSVSLRITFGLFAVVVPSAERSVAESSPILIELS